MPRPQSSPQYGWPLVLLSVIFLLILGLGSDRYLGPGAQVRRAHRVEFLFGQRDRSTFARPDEFFHAPCKRMEDIDRIETRLPVHEEARVEGVHRVARLLAVVAGGHPSAACPQL
jgi:hypothetical protein